MSYIGVLSGICGVWGIYGVWGYYPNNGESMAKKMDNEMKS